ncbi:hypothetical protein BsWGS_21774 [Bradybaena similaris]
MRSYCRLQDLLLLTLLAVASDGASFTMCSSAADCAPNQCCVRKSDWGGGAYVCAPVVSKGGECRVSNDQLSKSFEISFFIDYCQCEEGYSCQSDDDTSDTGKCVKQCSSNSHCAIGECCETLTAPGNRTKRDSYLGTCQTYSAARETCYVLDKKDDEVNFLCPCDTGLECQGTGKNFEDFPTGEAGVCVPVDTNDKAIPGK